MLKRTLLLMCCIVTCFTSIAMADVAPEKVYDLSVVDGKLGIWFLTLPGEDHTGESILIRTPNGHTVLVDGGIPEAGVLVNEALDKLNVEKIDVMIGTHMHIDHIGGLHYFEKTATIYVNKTEFEFALSLTHQSDSDNDFGFYVRSLVDVRAKKVVLIDKDQELFEGVHVINVPGHVAGLMALRVELESGDVLFTSDAANMASNYFEGVPGGIVVDANAASEAVKKLHNIQKENNIPDERVIFSHDEAQFAKLVKAPKWF